ncbi:MAG: hypothetical protein KDA27_27000 [Candidatus Eisenbacteria bacterium]|uniref:Uncharacterized protein n=1 Tax=Eiseniibacteriota bacterium TaxID=2212470 RepID=A0A956SG62_UNCEI|nr:hypothetical protein [Candidatus Eisenbacteria bacterium]MCB9464337.1 hypothetical protein [Candidatus Eisenbacteria bacterium]
MSIDKRAYFSFSDETQREIARRQNYVCAVCGTSLGAGNTRILVNFHHVIGVQSGNPANPAHTFIRTADNGVMVCDESVDKTRAESCHGLVAHGESRFAGFSAYANAFPYSHGRGASGRHRQWVKWIEERAGFVFATE